MPLGHAVAILAAGMGAGIINAIAGSGSLITFPTLLALGYDPVVANVSNTLGLVPGAFTGAVGYRAELAGQRGRIRSLGTASAAGGLTGGVLLLALGGAVFERIVPVLILVACALILLQPRLAARRLAAGRAPTRHGGPGLHAAIFATGIYGGYFGAAQGIILVALLGIFLDEHVQRLIGLKNALAAIVNGVAALLFIAVAPVAWAPAGLLAAASAVGGRIGALLGRRIPAQPLRIFIAVVGTGVAVRLML